MSILRLRSSISLFVCLILLLATALVAPVTRAANTGQEIAEPEIGARAAIVVEYPSGRILYSKAAHDKLAPASTTKILTAILAIEYGNLDDVVTISPDDLVGESTMGLKNGEQQTLRNLLYGMMLPSGNDAAMATARYLGSRAGVGSAPPADPIAHFAEMMNMRVAQLGLTDSHFLTPHGLDADGHYSSAYDLASLSWYALHLGTFNEIVRQVSYDAPGHPLLNANEMLTRYPGADGVKTGWTDAGGLCLVTSATRDGRRLISVVLNAPRWYIDSTALLNYGFDKLATTSVVSDMEVLSVAKRGTAAWFLANGTPVLPASAGAIGQGGGVAPVETKKEANAPAPHQISPATARQLAQPPLLSHTPAGPAGAPFWLIALIALVGATCCLLAARLWGFRPGMLFAGGRSVADNPVNGPGNDRPARAVLSPKHSYTTARTLGMPPLIGRREPNLLLSPSEEWQLHIERAIAAAWEGRQGASMSEFIVALRTTPFVVGDIAEAYDMPPNAFLALARAQLSLGYKAEAQRTLHYACEAAPDDRLTRLALSQLAANS